MRLLFSLVVPTFIVLTLGNAARAETEVYFSPRGGCEEHARLLVDSAKKELEVAVYSLNSPTIVAAIESALHRGVAVRVLTDRTQAFGKSNLAATRSLAQTLADFRVHSKNRIMHNKFAVADDRQVILGSYNWTRSAETSNDENCLLTDDPKVVQIYKRRFETHLWVINTAARSDEILASRGIKRGNASSR